MRLLITIAIGAFVDWTAAQYRISPDSVSSNIRQQWCLQQVEECPLICLQTSTNSPVTIQNTCDSENLTFNCTCGDGLSPNVTEYSQTLPYFICTEWGNQCVEACGANNLCAAACRQNHLCGASNPKRVKSTTSHKRGGSMKTAGANTSCNSMPAMTTTTDVAKVDETATSTAAVPRATKSSESSASRSLLSPLDDATLALSSVFVVAASLLGFALVL